MKLLGIALIVQGALALAYQGIRCTTTTTSEKPADGGGPSDVTTTTTEKKDIPLPPLVGAIAVVTGIVLILLNRTKKKINK